LVTTTDWILHQGTFGESVLIDASTGINEIMRLTAEREKLLEGIQRSNEELTQFSYVVSHDLQAPLRMMKTFTQLLATRYKGKLDETGDEFIQVILNGAAGMEELIHALLQYARVGEDDAAMEIIRMNSVVEAVLTILAPLIQESNAKVTYAELPTVHGFRVPLQQVFQNLIGNALKYASPQRPPRVHISSQTTHDSQIFSIEDNGLGIPPKDRESIFQPLKRLHGRDIPGTGIGLAVCRKIVERHNGRIWVESEPGRGSTFYFSLPRTQPPVIGIPEASRPVQSNSGPGGSL
jgi:light-regulated signal transduction histidine kinase (bacteriophytochrome)